MVKQSLACVPVASMDNSSGSWIATQGRLPAVRRWAKKDTEEIHREGKEEIGSVDSGGLRSLQHAAVFGEVLEEGLVEMLQERKSQRRG